MGRFGSTRVWRIKETGGQVCSLSKHDFPRGKPNFGYLHSLWPKSTFRGQGGWFSLWGVDSLSILYTGCTGFRGKITIPFSLAPVWRTNMIPDILQLTPLKVIFALRLEEGRCLNRVAHITRLIIKCRSTLPEVCGEKQPDSWRSMCDVKSDAGIPTQASDPQPLHQVYVNL